MPKFLIFLSLFSLAAFAQEPDTDARVKAELVADASAIAPGRAFQAGILLDMAPGWHTYWRSPGDSGFPTQVEWTLPEGFEVEALEWPIPQRIIEPGDIQVIAYKKRVLLMARVTPPASLSVATVDLQARVSWLVCSDICVPGSANLSLSLPVADNPAPANEALFSEFRQRLPDANAPPFPWEWKSAPDAQTLTLDDIPADAAIDLFPMPADGEEVGHPAIERNGDQVRLSVPAKAPFDSLLVITEGGVEQGYTLSAGGAPAPASSAAPSPVAPPAQAIGAPGSLLAALFYGFLGGLILNLMPCVLPVISLKIFGFIRQAGDSPRKILRHGLAFTAGIFAWFMALGLLIVALKSAGNQVTWAFQFQNPWFNLSIATLVFVFALNLFGVFEIVLPGRAASALSEASGGEGYAGSFFQGVFATLLATPCTAPFLGSALGFAFSQPSPVILAMFASISLGMASPYLVLSAKPGWMKILPKPGDWMERVKQFMGFPLMATLVWLLSILGGQKGLGGVIWAASFLLCLAFACWLYGAFCGPLSSLRSRVVALTLAAATAICGGAFFIGKQFAAAQRENTERIASADGIPWIPFSQKELERLLAEKRAVFLDFTADWCISCKYNEKTAIDRPAVRQALKDGHFIAMKADWTNSNPEITRALAAFGRVGVPFYVIYPAGRPEAPVILPEILTEQIVLDALEKAAQGR